MVANMFVVFINYVRRVLHIPPICSGQAVMWYLVTQSPS